MRRLFLLCLLCFPLILMAQNEYRFTGTFLGKNSTGLRSIKLDIEVMQGNKWKWIHRGVISTGANLDLATIETDTNYSARSWQQVMADAEIKELYTHYMDTYLKRIDAIDMTALNTPENKTENTMSLDLGEKVLTIQVRGKEGDNKMYIDICSLDNQYYVMYNKPVIPYSGNLIELNTTRLKSADYIVKVTPNKGEGFSGKVSIY